MSFADAFAGFDEPEPEKKPPAKKNAITMPQLSAASLPSSKTGKSSNPEFQQTTSYLHKATKKAAFRKFEDETNGEGDFSDLLDKLLREYLDR